MNSLHAGLMKRAVLANCQGQKMFILEDNASENKSRLVDENEYAGAMLGFASYIAENCPQLFSAIPLYHTYLLSPVTAETVKEFLGQSLTVVDGTFSKAVDRVYCWQTIILNSELKIELAYSYDGPLEAKVCYKSQLQEKLIVRSMSELCDVVERYSGEVVGVD